MVRRVAKKGEHGSVSVGESEVLPDHGDRIAPEPSGEVHGEVGDRRSEGGVLGVLGWLFSG